MKKILTSVFLVILLFSITGCNSLAGKVKFHNMYYDKLKDVVETKTDRGTFESGMEWDNVRYKLDNMIITITCYQKSSFDFYDSNEDLSDIKINKVDYRYMETEISGYALSHYYTQIGKDTYYISITYKKNDKTDKIVQEFLKSIVVSEK